MTIITANAVNFLGPLGLVIVADIILISTSLPMAHVI